MVSQNTPVGGITFDSAPIMVGAGASKTPESTEKWLKAAPVVSGSYTREARDGNQGNRLHYPDNISALEKNGFGLNAFGMPNIGFARAASLFSEMTIDQTLIISIAGFSAEEYFEGVEIFSKLSVVSAIECNFGCPNVAHGKIMSFDINFLEAFFGQLQESATPIWVKFSPYSDPGLLKEIAALVATYAHKIRAVVTCNTFPNAHIPETIDVNNGYAGMSGRALHPIALGQVRQFRNILPSDIDIIGVGGITSGFDVANMFDAGASGVQLTSLPFWLPNPNAFFETLFADGVLEKYLDERLKK